MYCSQVISKLSWLLVFCLACSNDRLCRAINFPSYILFIIMLHNTILTILHTCTHIHFLSHLNYPVHLFWWLKFSVGRICLRALPAACYEHLSIKSWNLVASSRYWCQFSPTVMSKPPCLVQNSLYSVALLEASHAILRHPIS